MQTSIDLLQNLVDLPSVNGSSGELALARKICELLQAEGLPARCQQVDENKANVLLFLQGADRERCIVWNGHLDTVEGGDLAAWTSSPWQSEIREGRLYGRGSSDMKAGLSAMLCCLINWKRRGIKPKTNLFFCATCDEERQGRGAEALLDYPEIASAETFIISEPTALHLCTAEKGCLWLKMKFCGKTSHAAYAEQGCNAATYAFIFAQALERALTHYHHPLLGKSTVVITGIHAGIASNMVPDQAEMSLDIRLTPDLPKTVLESIIHDCVEQTCRKAGGLLSIFFETGNERLPLALKEECFWAGEIRRASAELRVPCQDCGINFFSDASIFARVNPGADMIIWGPGEPQMAHQTDEYVKLERYQNYIDLLERVFAEEVRSTEQTREFTEVELR